MIIKDYNMEEKSKDIQYLEELKNNNPEKSKEIEEEIKKIKSGIKAENNAVYIINNYLSESKNYIVLHDLRLELNGRVAQIDHLIITRLLNFYVCESKHFSQGISFNERLEFSSFFNGKSYGIPSPIGQNDRHIDFLKYFFKNENHLLPKRLGFTLNPLYFNFILLSNNAIIKRAKRQLPENIELFKVEQLKKYIEDNAEKGSLLKIVSQDNLLILGQQILKYHQPIQFDWNLRFKVDNKIDIKPIEKKIFTEKSKVEPTFSINEDLNQELVIKNENIILEPENKKETSYKCEICNTNIDNSVLFWCRKNKIKFNNQILCREHQPK